ncbi:MAG: GNAT family N-acetyltransferase [Candidatus Wallbacteria bacterium]|nr:GNAT family N-acetyltransferase [Candidatus Wallbacteria bacterium]
MSDETTYLSELPAGAVEEHLDQTAALWGEGHPRDVRLRETLRELAAWGPQRLRLAGLVGGTGALVSSLERFGLRLQGPDGPVAAIGLGSIFTPEPERGRGLARRLIRLVMEEARVEGCSAVLLFSDIAPEYYERLGFVRYPAQRWTVPLSSLPQAAPLETRPAADADIGRLLEWYESSFPASVLRPIRDLESWRAFRRKNSQSPDLVLLEDGVAVGYLNLARAPERLWINEYAPARLSAERVWATAARHGAEAGAAEMGGWVRLDPLPPAAALRDRPRAIPMIAPLDSRLELQGAVTHFDAIDHF